MNVQNPKIKVLQIIVFVVAILIMQSTSKAQTALEQQCFDSVQNKVAYDQAGSKTWNPNNIRRLCQGTINPGATIACFQAQIKQHNDWDRGINACQPPKQEEKTASPFPSAPENARTLTFKNNAHIQAMLYVGAVSTGQLNIGESKTVEIKEKSGTPLQVSVEMRLLNPGSFVIYQGTIAGNNRATSFCFEAKGDVGKPSVTPCNGTQAVEAKKIEIRNEAGFTAKATFNYFAGGVAKSISTDQFSIGINRVFYLPADADKNKDITLKALSYDTAGERKIRDIRIDPDSGSALCYKFWGVFGAPKISPCSPSASARTIKLKSMGAFNTRLDVVYYDQFLQKQSVNGNLTAFTETDVMEIPRGIAAKPIEINFKADDGKHENIFHTATVPADFTGEVCFKTEGTMFNPNVSSCDDELNVSPNVDSRQIVFKNEAGYDAQIFVQYFEMQNIGGTKVPMPKTIASGFINLGKSRTITIPKDSAPNTPITIILQGNATVKNDIWSTTLPADFKGSPIPCFKVWGSLFDPKGGKCN